MLKNILLVAGSVFLIFDTILTYVLCKVSSKASRFEESVEYEQLIKNKKTCDE